MHALHAGHLCSPEARDLRSRQGALPEQVLLDVSKRLTWHAARADCRARNASLVSLLRCDSTAQMRSEIELFFLWFALLLYSEQVHKFVKRQLDLMGGVPFVWLGASRRDGVYWWPDGTQLRNGSATYTA